MTTVAYSLKKIQVLGVTRDFTTCECCGKSDLSKTIEILDTNSGVVLHFGATCAVKADKYDTLDAMKESKKEISKAVRKYDDRIKSAHIMTYKALVKFGKDSNGELIVAKCIIEDCFKKALNHIESGILIKGGFTYSL
ncbi:MAG: hypothetical protein BWY15_02104 [Firmicutes bacterium ADurb.Bin193]|nr:MAG: hypothetical protein BWY15_02104 [Firmicutes bacterium ADurb.Bin193]